MKIESPDTKSPAIPNAHPKPASSLLETIFLPLVKQICLRGAKVDNLWAAISVLLQHGALLAVVGVRHSWASTDDTTALVGAVVTLVTYPD